MTIQQLNSPNVTATSIDNELSGMCTIPLVVGVANFTIGVFFDGTGNNKFNVASIEENGDSYRNGLSNVAKSWKHYTGSYNGTDVVDDFNYYAQGIGTTRDEEDSGLGFGFGIGETGIKKRVRLAAFEILEPIINRIQDQEINTVEIVFDVFGFSRGAAAARHFIYKNSTPRVDYYRPPIENHDGRLPLPKPIINYNNDIEVFLNAKMQRFEHNKIEVKIRWRFAGLYETVSSYGEFDPNFEDDVEELGLMNLDKVEGILHIVGEDEYRENFSITPIVRPRTFDKIDPFKIGTPGSDYYRETIVIPGVHSDIGGGYNLVEIEKDLILYRSNQYTIYHNGSERPDEEKLEHDKMLRIKEWFIDQGWFNENNTDFNNISIKRKTQTARPNATTYIYELIGSRTDIANTYSFIPLKIMTEKAKLCNVPFNVSNIESENSFSHIPLLNDTYSHIKAQNFPPSFDIKKLRNEYLHWSSRYNETRVFFIASISPHAPRLNSENEEEFKRLIIKNLSVK